MSNSQKISQMTSATIPLTGSELVPLVQNGANVKATVQQIAANNGLAYQGTWDANTNTPTITSSVGTTGNYYIVSVAGSTSVNGISSWNIGDWIIFSDTGVWQKIGGGTVSSLQIAGVSGSTTYKVPLTTASSGLINTEYVDASLLTYTSTTGLLYSTKMQSTGYRLDGMTAGTGALYYNAGQQRVTLANYNAGGHLVFEVDGGAYTARFNADKTIQFLNTYNHAVTSAPKALYIDSSGVIGYYASAAPPTNSYGSFLQNGATTLTDAMTNNSTTPIVVGDTTEFGSSGYIIIEDEVIQYTGKTATSFTGITRGVKGTTNVSHDPGVSVVEAAAVASATTSAAIKFDTTVYSSDISITSNSRVTFANAGIYNIQFSLQFLNYTSSEDNVTVWFKLNGSDIAQSASVQQVNSSHGGNPGAAILSLNLFQQVTAGQYIELYWASGTGNTVLGSYPAGTSPVTPVSPAVILTATQVA